MDWQAGRRPASLPIPNGRAGARARSQARASARANKERERGGRPFSSRSRARACAAKAEIDRRPRGRERERESTPRAPSVSFSCSVATLKLSTWFSVCRRGCNSIRAPKRALQCASASRWSARSSPSNGDGAGRGAGKATPASVRVSHIETQSSTVSDVGSLEAARVGPGGRLWRETNSNEALARKPCRPVINRDRGRHWQARSLACQCSQQFGEHSANVCSASACSH